MKKVTSPSAKRRTFAIASVLLFAFCSLHFAILSHAQAPQTFNYQLIARDTAGSVFSNRTLGLQISIIQDAANGTVVYGELHTATTNKYGLVNLAIGTGSVVSGSFQLIDWGTHQHFVKLEIDPDGGTNYFTMGTTLLVSVPYALYAEKAGNVVDTSNTNELQALSISNDTLFLSNGGFVKLPSAVSAVWTQEGNNIYNANSGNVGIGTNAPAGKFIVKGDSLAPATEPLFEVKNKDGDAVFVVYQDSVKVIIPKNASKATSQGGFAVSGRSSSKGATNDYFVITPDSARIYLDESADKATSQGGFAVSGRSSSKGTTNDYLSVNSDSIKASKSLYIPRMTTVERDNMGFVPSEALIIFNITDKCMQIYETGVWSNIWCFHCTPTIITQPNSVTICSGQDTSFTLSATGTSLIYKWQKSSDDGNTWSDISDNDSIPAYSGSNSWTLSISNVPVSHNGYKYRCNVAASCLPDVTSNEVTLNVGSTPPAISEQPADQQLSTDCTVNFNISSPGSGVIYHWEASADGITWLNFNLDSTLIYAGVIFSGVNTSSLLLSNVPLICNNYKVRCIVGNSCGSDATSIPATLTVNNVLEFETQPTDQYLSNDRTATFYIDTLDLGITYQWQESADGGSDWNDITDGGTNPAYIGASSPGLTLTNVPLSFNGYKYRCVISHLCRSSATSEEVTLIISTPTLTTTIAGSITSISAISGGDIQLDGGAEVTARGICWSTSTNPDITNNYTTDGVGTGGFTSGLTGLTPGVTYYVRAYATNIMGTAYGNQISFIAIEIGNNFQGGIVAYILQPEDLGYIAGEMHGLIAAPSDQSTGAEWGCLDTEISGADGGAIGTGGQNTIDIMNGCLDAGIAARLCGDLVLGGYDDWYLPSHDELYMLYLNRAAIGNLANSNYWSSTELLLHQAWSRDFNDGYEYGNMKNYPSYVRAVRSISTDPIYSNDECINATLLTENPTCVPVSDNSNAATQSIPAITCATYTGNADDDVWYKFVATTVNPIITVVGSGGFDAVVDLRSGTCDGTPIDCADNVYENGTEIINASGLAIGGTYYIRVYHYSAGGGEFTICVSE